MEVFCTEVHSRYLKIDIVLNLYSGVDSKYAVNQFNRLVLRDAGEASATWHS